jgi:hypothetical protein
MTSIQLVLLIIDIIFIAVLLHRILIDIIVIVINDTILIIAIVLVFSFCHKYCQ